MLPNKILDIQDSIIWKLPYILDVLVQTDYGVRDLYLKMEDKFEDISEFLVALDILYVLQTIAYNEKYEVLQYVERN